MSDLLTDLLSQDKELAEKHNKVKKQSRQPTTWITIAEAAQVAAQAGKPLKENSIKKSCQAGRIKAEKRIPAQGVRIQMWFIEKTSFDAYLETLEVNMLRPGGKRNGSGNKKGVPLGPYKKKEAPGE